MNSSLPVNSKSNTADDKMEIVHLRGARWALSCHSNPRPDTRAQLVPADLTVKNQIQPTRDHRRPIASIVPRTHEVEPTQTCTYKSRKKTGMHDGNPMLFHTTQGGGFVQDLTKPRKISPYLSSKKTRPISNKYQWSSDCPMDLDDELPRIQTRAAGMHQEPCGSETIQDSLCQ